jgi:hypothetical protein
MLVLLARVLYSNEAILYADAAGVGSVRAATPDLERFGYVPPAAACDLVCMSPACGWQQVPLDN